MISAFKLKFGRSPSALAEKISAVPITVFVGPNNSGKSKILREIYHYCNSGIKTADLLLDLIEFSEQTLEEAEKLVEELISPPDPHERIPYGEVVLNSLKSRTIVNKSEIISCIQNPTRNLVTFCKSFLSHKILMLSPHQRIELSGDQDARDLHRPGQSTFNVLIFDNVKRLEIRRVVYEAFNRFFVVEPTHLGYLRLRLSKRAPKDEIEEIGIHESARNFHKFADLVSDLGDGVRAFIGMIVEIFAGDPKILLIDEPESFLHPSLAFKLGQEISRAAFANQKTIFVATHSSSFLMGCVQSGKPIDIIRLTYREGVATSRILPSQEIIKLMRHPLLRSVGMLNALFYEYVIVTEADTDRAFYQEINERLLQLKPEWGISNCLFINAQNKQTLHTIVQPLRRIGIPTIAIADIDLIKNEGSDWTQLLTSANVPPMYISSLNILRVEIKKAMVASGRDMKRDGGINILPTSELEAAKNFLEQLAEYGILVVPGGEVESWLSSLGASGHGPNWLTQVFERMGEDPDSDQYVKPTEDDVWKFISRAKAWLSDSNRKGIPE